MKIYFANGRRTYPLFNGGDGILIHDYLLELSHNGRDITAIGKINNPDFKESTKIVANKLTKLGIKLNNIKSNVLEYKHNDNYSCKLFSENAFLKQLEIELIKNKPDIILTQLNYSHKVIEIASKLNIKIILLIHDNHAYNFLPINKGKSISHIVFNSKNTANHFKQYLNCPYSIIYPCIKEIDYRDKTVNKNFLTMINPTDNKGGNILLEIIKNMPNEFFLVVKGWKKLDIKFTKFKNVKIIDRQYDMRKVYSQTKILLVPSQWEEAFARVVPEAMVSGIPVVASKVGGLIESVGNAGVLIDDFVNPKSWILEIRKLLNDDRYFNNISNLGFAQSKKFKFKNGFQKLMKVLNSVHNS